MKNDTRSFFGPAPRRAVCIILWLAFAAASAFATDVTFFGSSGTRQAAVEFRMVGNVLYVTLRNTSMTDAMLPTDMLAGVFFDTATNPVLTPEWARVDTGSCLIYPTDAGCTSPVQTGPLEDNLNLGGEWAYRQFAPGSSSPVPTHQRYGIGAVGLDFFGLPGWAIPGPNIAGPVGIDGGNFSLAPRGDDPATGNGGVERPYVLSAAVFTFLAPAGFDPSAAIRNIRFQYGTSFSEAWIPSDPVPEPATFEPTASSSKEDLDWYAAVIRQVCEEAYSEPDRVKTAPHQAPVHKVDASAFDDPDRWAMTWRAFLRKRGEPC